MKITYTTAVFTAIIGLAFTISSCKDNLLEEPYSTLSAEAVFVDEDGLKKATLGIYQGFTSNAFTSWYRFGMAETGHQYSAQGIFGDAFWVDQNTFTGTPSSQISGELNAIWAQDYNIIARANTVIANALKAVNNEETAEVYIAEARFLRGFAYFDLVRHFGGVPIVDQQITSLNQSELLFGERSSIEQTYDFIVADMLAAIEKLPDQWTGANKGRVSAGVAKAMLGKVYLTMAGNPLNVTANYQKAIAILSEVVGPENEAKYGFAILPSFKNVFDLSNERNEEILLSFNWHFSSSSAGSVMPFYTLPRGLASADEQTFYGLTYKFYELFEDQDVRRDITLVTRFKSVYTGDGATIGDSIIYNANRMKYIDTVTHVIFGNATINQGIAYAKFDRTPRATGSGSSFSVDMVMLRFSDVLLSLAEAQIEGGGDQNAALSLINRVRSRAGASLYEDTNNLRARVRLERRLELTGEFTTVFDIRRWGTLEEEIEAMDAKQVSGGIKGTYDQKFELYPIPLAQIQANPNLSQNLGY